jgi:hypothetical protein
MAYKFEVLVEEGDFRIARVKGDAQHQRWIVVQHRCDPDVYVDRLFSDNGWSLCYHSDRRCYCCKTPEPDKMIGFHDLIMWNNTEYRV